VVDWSAAIWAGIIAGAAFLLLSVLIAPRLLGGNGWIAFRYAASILLGERILPPPATFDPAAVIAGLLVYFSVALVFALLIAIILHRWGLVVGILGGALIGVALYFITFYTLTLLFPWLFVVRGSVLLISHVIFGALAGGIYEALEVEQFVAVE
jgi:hypothetical protein